MSTWKRTFFILWSGQAFSLLSSALVQFAIILWVTIETGSASVLAMATIAGLVPQIVLGPFIGVWVDRWNRKAIMIAADLFIALCCAVIALLYRCDLIEMWHIYLLLAARSVGGSFHFPAMQASVPLLAPERHLTRIAGITQALQSISNIAGPALGALLVSTLPMNQIMWIDVAGAVIASSSLLFIRIPPTPPVEGLKSGSVIREMLDGLRAIWHDRGLTVLMAMWILFLFFYMPAGALYPLMTYDYFGGTPFQMGMAEVAFAVGMLMGGVLIGIWGTNHRRVLMIMLACIVNGAAFVFSGVLPHTGYYWFLVWVVVMGLTVPFFNSPLISLIQTRIEPGMLGRVFSLFGTLAILPAPLGLLAAGPVADRIGVNTVFVVVGAMIGAIGIACFFIPVLMRMDRELGDVRRR
ncbi:MAG: MFS transporter [Rikenellaceae bacterium]|nr:MFS transporter [Rikenellaceae bacterium]